MRLLIWPAGGGLRRVEKVEEPFQPEEGSRFWLDLDLQDDSVSRAGEFLPTDNALLLSFLSEEHPRPLAFANNGYLYAFLQELDYRNLGEVRVTGSHFLIKDGCLITAHQETPGGLQSIWESGPAVIGKLGMDHLFYLIADAMVDSGFPALDGMSDRVEGVEDEVFPEPAAGVQNRIFALRKDLLHLRRTISPMREALAQLTRLENPLIGRDTSLLLGGVYDHLVRLYELVNSQREVLDGLMELYLAGISNRSNEIMKTLTIIATIMMPLTLITGIYGMNFRYMPGLNWIFSFPVSMAGMILIGGGMLYAFHRRGWF